MDGTDAVFCEVCGVPHRRGAGVCENCGHVLGRAPDWHAIRGQRDSYARHFFAALLIVLAMLVLNFVLFQGYGYILYVPAICWMVFSGYRYRVLSGRLRDDRSS